MFKERLKEAVFGFYSWRLLRNFMSLKKVYFYMYRYDWMVYTINYWTFDDTSMLLATIDSINVNNYTVNIEDMRNRYINW